MGPDLGPMQLLNGPKLNRSHPLGPCGMCRGRVERYGEEPDILVVMMLTTFVDNAVDQPESVEAVEGILSNKRGLGRFGPRVWGPTNTHGPTVGPSH
jgi:hypothetical protein